VPTLRGQLEAFAQRYGVELREEAPAVLKPKRG
jgi:hypothetical protein